MGSTPTPSATKLMQTFVIKTPDINQAVAFFTQLGLTFVQEKHGDGPVHYACERNGIVFEIYPSTKPSGSCKFHNF